MAAFALLLTSCNSCGPKDEPEQKSDAVVITSDDWDDLIEKSVIGIQTAYPEYTFYEASGNLKKLPDGKWGVDRSTFHIAFGKINGIGTVTGVVKNDTLVLAQFDEPWLEDVHMTPFVGYSLNDAIEKIQSEIDIAFQEGECAVLRHQLFPGIYEPEYLIGSWSSCHSCRAFSGEVDVPIKDLKGLQLEPKNDKFFK